ncbi:Replicase polyprotein 1a [Tupaia chinensis]|uniref:Replicase polyprotein 1a n=1 Tax=Tupaia chinensis TaxID=246437 RepID=L9KNK3_TUPCH|nr:Replicase polyprotein 1a [Tupaia chinensis]
MRPGAAETPDRHTSAVTKVRTNRWTWWTCPHVNQQRPAVTCANGRVQSEKRVVQRSLVRASECTGTGQDGTACCTPSCVPDLGPTSVTENPVSVMRPAEGAGAGEGSPWQLGLLYERLSRPELAPAGCVQTGPLLPRPARTRAPEPMWHFIWSPSTCIDDIRDNEAERPHARTSPSGALTGMLPTVVRWPEGGRGGCELGHQIFELVVHTYPSQRQESRGITVEHDHHLRETGDAEQYLRVTGDAGQYLRETGDANQYLRETGDADQYLRETGDAYQYLRVTGDADQCLRVTGDADQYLRVTGDADQYLRVTGDADQYLRVTGDADQYLRVTGDADQYLRVTGDADQYLRVTGDADQYLRVTGDADQYLRVTGDADQYLRVPGPRTRRGNRGRSPDSVSPRRLPPGRWASYPGVYSPHGSLSGRSLAELLGTNQDSAGEGKGRFRGVNAAGQQGSHKSRE